MDKQSVHLGCRAYVRDGNIVWFSNFTFNGLFKVDLDTGKVDFVHKFDGIPINQVATHGFALKRNNELVFFPLYDDKIIVYNIRNDQQEAVAMPKADVSQGLLSGICANGNQVLLFPVLSGNAVWNFNIEKRSLEREGWLSDFFENSLKEGLRIRTSAYREQMVLCVIDGHVIWEFDLDQRKKRLLKIDIGDEPVNQVVFDGHDYWVLMENSQIVHQWNEERGLAVQYAPEHERWVGSYWQVPFNCFGFVGDEVYLANYYALNVMKICRGNKEMKVAFEYPLLFRIIKELAWGAVFSGMETYKDAIMLLPQRGNMILVFNYETNNARGMELKIWKREIPHFNELCAMKMNAEKCILETQEIYDLKTFCSSLEQGDSQIMGRGNVGASIYRFA